VAAAVSAARDSGRYAGLILSGAALSPLDWVLALGDANAADLDLDRADLSSDPFYLDQLAHDPLAFASAADARSLTAVLPAAWDKLAGDFGQVALPVLLVHGSEDPVVPVAGGPRQGVGRPAEAGAPGRVPGSPSRHPERDRPPQRGRRHRQVRPDGLLAEPDRGASYQPVRPKILIPNGPGSCWRPPLNQHPADNRPRGQGD
jgi:hypothetical protein